jgi:hypothetical protein
MADQFTPRLEKIHLQNQSKRLEIGLMGLIFGDVANKPGNIAAAAIVLAFGSLLIVLFLVSDSEPKNQAITLFGSIITGALGYLFGRSSQ